MNKYYQPSLEEFHIGFRYEYKTKDTNDPISHKESLEWKKHIFNETNLSGGWDGETHLYDVLNNNIEYRTKHLDKIDIEELGWKEESKNFYKIVDGYYDKEEDGTGTEYRLTVRNNFIFIEFYQIYFGEPSVPYRGADYLFRGTIKNYNELKTLMKQLNIKQ